MTSPLNHINFERSASDQKYYTDLAGIIVRGIESHCCNSRIPWDKLRILDVGCGKGEIMQGIKEKGGKPIGVDIQWECAKKSKNYGNTIVSDIMKLDNLFPRNSFDVIVASHVLEHIDNSRQALEILKRLSNRWLLLAVPNLSRLANFFARTPRHINKAHFHGWDSHHFKTFLEIQCGLKITQWLPDGIILSPLHKGPGLRSRLLNTIEYKILPKFIPHMANSLITLCEKA